MRCGNFIDVLVQDLRYASRNLRRSPGFATLAILIMTLGIGANTAVFSVVNAVLLKPLAYSDPDRIVTLSDFSKSEGAPTALSRQVSIPNVLDWHDQSSSFEAMAYYASREIAVLRGSVAEYARVTRVSPEFFHVFGVGPMAGRFFTAEELEQGGSGVAMISYAYWQSRFGADPRAVGQSVRVNGLRTIVGVMPPGFAFPEKTDLWFPATRGSASESRSEQNYLAVARLRAGVSCEQAQAEISSIARRLEEVYPKSNKGHSVALRRMRDDMVGEVRLTLYLLIGAVGVVLLIACANTATLLLGKAMARTREVAVRTALGASRWRLVRQLVTESLSLAFIAGVSGLLLAFWASKALVALAPLDLPRLAEVGIDRWVLAFTLGISIITSLLFGLVPAFYVSKVDLNNALKQGGTRSVIGGGMVRMRGVLVVAELVLAVVLLSGAGLLIRSLVALNNVGLGFQPENVLVMRATVPDSSAATFPRARQFFGDLLSKIRTLPGVIAAGATMATPGYVDSTGAYLIDQLPANGDWTGAPNVVFSIATPGTFSALRIPLKRGRDFSDSDTLDRPFVAVVNEALVRRAFPDQNPLGRTIFCPFDSFNGMTIIGVVGDVRQRGPASDPMPECYMTYAQHAFNGTTLSVVARTSADPNALAEAVRRLALEQSPDVPVKFATMEAMLSENIAVPRFRSLLFGVFAGLAVCLAMVGVYGVTAYSVSQRSKEIGLRIALGASTASVFRLILGQGLVLAGVGLCLGLTSAVAGARILRTMLFQVQPNDPMVYLGVAAFLGLVTLIASFVPARRATKIDPLPALRQE